MNYAVRAVEGVKSGFVALSPFQKNFDNRVAVEFTRGHFTVKTIDSRRELWQVYKLRYEVFHREYKNKRFPFGFDKDRYDQFADHLAIIDNRIGKIVGTYRLLQGRGADDFYSASEFDISGFLSRSGSKVELSRACIHRDYRNGTIITLLWRGICEYVANAGARWLFGMGSFKTVDPRVAAEAFKQLTVEGRVDPSLQVPAIGKYVIPGLPQLIENAQISDNSANLVPALVRSYLKAGAVVGSDVAIDEDFNCADFFVALDMNAMSSTFSRKYQIH